MLFFRTKHLVRSQKAKIDKAARAYAKQAWERYAEYMKYSKDNRVAYYPDRCKVCDGEELITPRYKRILDLYKAKI